MKRMMKTQYDKDDISDRRTHLAQTTNVYHTRTHTQFQEPVKNSHVTSGHTKYPITQNSHLHFLPS